MKVNNTSKKFGGMLKFSLLAGLSIIVMVTQSACGIFRDEPTTLAIKHIENLVTMPEMEYALLKKKIALREQASIDYLRARMVQNAKYSYDIEDIHRPKTNQREVVISISEKRGAGASHERARFRAYVDLGADNKWQVASLKLVE